MNTQRYWKLVAALGLLVMLYLTWYQNANKVLQLEALLRTSREEVRDLKSHLDQRKPQTGRFSATSPKTDRADEAYQAAERDMRLRRARGEYILELEDPAARHLSETMRAQMVTDTASRNALKYDRLFSDLGVAPETSAQLQNHLSKIHAASLDAEATLLQLLSAREDYRKRVQAALGEENYPKYYAAEMAKPAEHELDLLRQYMQQSGTKLDPSLEPTISTLMQESAAYTEKYWHGPFDSIPQVAVGTNMVAIQLQNDVMYMKQHLGTLTARATEADLPSDVMQALDDYYQSRIQRKEKAVAGMGNAEQEAFDEIARTSNAVMKARLEGRPSSEIRKIIEGSTPLK